MSVSIYAQDYTVSKTRKQSEPCHKNMENYLKETLHTFSKKKIKAKQHI
jgi:hypothetical protein